MKLPPRIVRRVVLDPLLLLLALLLLAISPVFLVAALVVDVRSRGRWPTTRLVLLAMAYLALDAIGIVALFVLWIASGFGLWMRSRGLVAAHYGLMGWWLHGLYASATKLLGLDIRIEDAPAPRLGPVLVFSRHSGFGDSFFLADTLMHGFRRRCRVVMKYELQLDPVIDIAGNRCPNAFVRPNSAEGERFAAAIGALATDLTPRDALVLFPEGGNYTMRRWVAAIASLRRRGFDRDAARAESMRNLLPPRPAGASAAIDAAPRADVVFVAHTGLEDLDSLPALWRQVPVRTPVRARYWRLVPSEIPSGRQERIDWLFAWWETIDRWISERRQEPARP